MERTLSPEHRAKLQRRQRLLRQGDEVAEREVFSARVARMIYHMPVRTVIQRDGKERVVEMVEPIELSDGNWSLPAHLLRRPKYALVRAALAAARQEEAEAAVCRPPARRWRDEERASDEVGGDAVRPRSPSTALASR